MTYNFINQSDESLKALSTAVFEEQKYRFHKTIAFRPPPDFVYSDGGGILLVESIRWYREQHHCTLSEAKWVVEYFMREQLKMQQ